MLPSEAVNSDEDAASMDEANHAATLLWPGLQQVLAGLPDTTSSNTTDTTSRDTPDFDSRVALVRLLFTMNNACNWLPLSYSQHRLFTAQVIHSTVGLPM